MPHVRTAGEGDAAQISAIYAPVVRETIITFEEEPPSPDEFRERIRNVLTTYPWLVAEHNGELMGYAYASAHHSRAGYRWSADVSVYIAGAHRGKGVGRALYTSLLRLLAVQGMYNVYAGIALPNPASTRLHESFGFTPVGVYRRVGFKHGRWVDVGWWELALREHSAPGAPLPLSEICHSDEWAQALAAGTALLQ